ncbi:MAG TPA: bacteriohemerythrin [Bacteroidota bacterium]|jgi:hemerythrin|nr:bacteriohemerythrin [Bacteroidota bacterium]
MPLVQWSSNLSVGVPSLDAEHKQLLELINKMHEAMQRGEGKTVVANILDQLIRYTQTHFKHEEEIMAKTRYPQAAVHSLHHNQLTKKVLELQKELANGSVSVTLEVMNFLKSWLQDHIIKMDKLYTHHFQNNGVQ